MNPVARQAIGLAWLTAACCAGVAGAADDRAARASIGAAREACLAQARAALASGDGRRALTLLKTRGLRIETAERRSIEGRAHFLLGDYPTARRKLRAAIRLRPRQGSDHYWLGRVYQAGGAPALAAASYERAYRHGLEHAELHHHWAEVLRDAGQAWGDLRHVDWTGEPADVPAPGTFAFDGLVLGTVPSRPGRLLIAPARSALYQVYKALGRDPKRGDSLLLCGELWAAADRHRQAVGLYERAAERLEGRPLARCHEAWARSAWALNDTDGYLKHTRLHMQHGDGVDAERLARCYDRAAQEAANLGELQRQIRYLTFAVELKPEVDRLLRLADALLVTRRSADALGYLHQAADLKPSRRQRRAIEQRLLRTRYLASPD